MTAVPIRIVKHRLVDPDRNPIVGKTVTARLNTLAFIDDGTAPGSLTTEIIRTAYATTDSNGVCTFTELSVNSAITTPVGTSYTLRIPGSDPLTIIVPSGDPTVPVWASGCLAVDPVNPQPIGLPIAAVMIIDNGDGTQTITVDGDLTLIDNGDGTADLTLAGTTVTVGGGVGQMSRSVSTVTTTVTLGAAGFTDYVAFIGASGAPTMPTAVGNTNRYTVKNIRGTNVTLATASAQTIDGSTTAVLTPNTSLDLVSDGANWRVV